MDNITQPVSVAIVNYMYSRISLKEYVDGSDGSIRGSISLCLATFASRL